MNYLFVRNGTGPQIAQLKAALATELGGDAALFPNLRTGNTLDADTEAALRRWQAGRGLVADGVAGPRCFTLLGIRKPVALELPADALGTVRMLFPQTKPSNIARHLPYVTDALEAFGLTDRAMVLAALGTIRAETAGFVPITELPSQFNTRPGFGPFSKYEPDQAVGRVLGNTSVGDGARYAGRGFVQLTGRDNYKRYGAKLGIDLEAVPERANAPEVAACLLAAYLAHHAPAMRAALAAGNYKAARKLVNGGSHGLAEFTQLFQLAQVHWPPRVAGVSRARAGVARASAPSPLAGRTRSTQKDPVDLRDRPYQPPPTLLPDQYPAEADISRYIARYAALVRDQQTEGSCTGFGLACVINFARWQKAGYPAGMESVSPRMLYTYARRYDEFAGEDYEGSSCRGALKGWFRHGVCLESEWPYGGQASYGYAQKAARTPLGVYYRIDVKSIVDMQAAIVQAHAIFVSAFTHDAWDVKVAKRKPKAKWHDALPVIAFDGRASRDGGHAFALVGFNQLGFIVQNSWGPGWGLQGFAVLTYADWLANGMDAWVASLGVSGVIAAQIGAPGAGGTRRAGALAANAGWHDEQLRRHTIVTGNDGRVTRYLTEDELSRSLVHQCCTLPDQWFRTDAVAQQSASKHLVIYAHGGLNSEGDALKRARAMGRFFTGNGCYPLFLVWKTGLLESIGYWLQDKARGEPVLAGRGWEFTDASDFVLEQTVGRLAKGIWSEMKGNAKLSCQPTRGGELLITALAQLASTWGSDLKVHVIGHSAGSILLGHLLTRMAQRKLDGLVSTAHLYAPACSVQFANEHYAPYRELMGNLYMDILDDERERADSVAGAYRKSLLYFVSNALEDDVRTPLLGLFNAMDPAYGGWDGSSVTGEALGAWRTAARAAKLDRPDRTIVVKAARIPVYRGADGMEEMEASEHGSFDNDLDVVARTIGRITGNAKLRTPVDDLRGF